MNRSLGIVALVISVLSLSLFPVYGNAATAYIVSGMVTAPGGIIASDDKTGGASLARVLDFFVTSAEAKLSGLLPVPNGTPVELVRMGNGGGTSAPIATTTTRYGRYQFNLSALRLTVSPRLIVRVGNVATGAQMRAFVTDKTVSINPISETVVRMVLDTIASTQDGTLSNFTVTELEDLNGSLDLLTSSIGMQSDADIESSVLAVRNAVSDNRGIVNFLTACARPGQTSAGPGDIGNYFPFTQGVSWTYTIRETEDGIASRPYKNTVKVYGTRLVNGVATTVFKESNPDGDGKPDYFYYRKTSSGGFDWTPVKDGSRKTPYRAVHFPAAPGSSSQQSLGDLGLSEDIDRDGIVERFNFTATTTVLGLETVSVPAGTLRNSLKIRTVATGSATMSSTRKKITVTDTQFEWYAQNLGLAKLVDTIRITYDKNIWKDTHTQELTEANGFPLTGDFPLNRWKRLNIKTNDIAYDQVSGKIFASVPSNANLYANSIIVIDPNTATVERAIPVDNNPGPIAVSDDGQFLYVGLNGDQAAVLQILIPTMTLGPVWPVSYLPGTVVKRFPYHIAVQPGNPQVIAVSTSSSRFDGSYSPFHDGTVILDEGAERRIGTPNVGWGPTIIEFTNAPSLAYGFNEQSPFQEDLSVLSITSDGITVSERRTDFDGGSILHLKVADDLIYTSSGRVYDAQLSDPVGSYISSYFGLARIEPTVALNRVGILTHSLRLCLEVFDMSSYIKEDELCMPTEGDDYPTNLENVGYNTYAVRVHDSNSYMDAPSWLVFFKFVDSN